MAVPEKSNVLNLDMGILVSLLQSINAFIYYVTNITEFRRTRKALH